MQAQQLVEEQRRQMDMMDMDNTRISEQINLEIQKVKVHSIIFKLSPTTLFNFMHINLFVMVLPCYCVSIFIAAYHNFHAIIKF